MLQGPAIMSGDVLVLNMLCMIRAGDFQFAKIQQKIQLTVGCSKKVVFSDTKRRLGALYGVTLGSL